MTALLNYAADMARAEAKRLVPCRCAAHPFPHRRTWRCDDLAEAARDDSDERTRAELDAEELALFDAAEARAINSGAW